MVRVSTSRRTESKIHPRLKQSSFTHTLMSVMFTPLSAHSSCLKYVIKYFKGYFMYNPVQKCIMYPTVLTDKIRYIHFIHILPRFIISCMA